MFFLQLAVHMAQGLYRFWKVVQFTCSDIVIGNNSQEGKHCYWSVKFEVIFSSCTRFAKKEKASTALSSCVCSTTSKSTWEDSLAIWTRWWKNEDLTVFIFFFSSLCSVEPAWLGGMREQECQMYQNMVVWPLSIYYVCREPFVLAWFHCWYTLNDFLFNLWCESLYVVKRDGV